VQDATRAAVRSEQQRAGLVAGGELHRFGAPAQRGRLSALIRA
jgi:hypothetical protein